MRREILSIEKYVSNCCPGHDTYPNETYKNRRSKRARARDKKKERRHARHVINQGVAQLGRAGVLDTQGRRFESFYPDHFWE